MKKSVMRSWLGVICLTALLIGCSDDEKVNDLFPAEVSARYSNKTSPTADSKPLLLTYSGSDFYGKEVDFELSANYLGTITLYGVFAGEEETKITGVTVENTEDGYLFSGEATSVRGTTFKYSGEITEESLNLDLSDIKIAGNMLSTQQNYTLVPTSLSEMSYSAVLYVTPSDPEMAGTFELINGLAPIFGGAILDMVLKDVCFLEDGNVIATYHSLPGELGDLLMQILSGSMEKPTEGWQTSPLNLVSYYVEDGYLYVVPQLEMIMAAVAARAESDASVIADLLLAINKWLTNGLRLNMNTDMTMVAGGAIEYAGDLEIYLDREELQPVLSAIPLLLSLIEDTSDEDVAEILEILTQLLTNGIDTLELGIMLNKN